MRPADLSPDDPLFYRELEQMLFHAIEKLSGFEASLLLIGEG
ncbi:hypothetical protein ACCS75_15115 [Rhizobium ruizarguesonis]